MKKKARRRITGKPGDIIAIRLAVAGFAYGKLYKNCGLGVYDLITTELANADEVRRHRFWFHCCIFDNAIKSGKWKVIGSEPFSTEESSWPPPMFYFDELSGGYEIRHKGIHRPATARQVRGLDPEMMYFPVGLLERIEAERDK